MNMSGEVKVGKCGVTRVTGLENVELRWGSEGIYLCEAAERDRADVERQYLEGSEGELGSSCGATLKAEGGEGNNEESV